MHPTARHDHDHPLRFWGKEPPGPRSSECGRLVVEDFPGGVFQFPTEVPSESLRVFVDGHDFDSEKSMVSFLHSRSPVKVVSCVTTVTTPPHRVSARMRLARRVNGVRRQVQRLAEQHTAAERRLWPLEGGSAQQGEETPREGWRGGEDYFYSIFFFFQSKFNHVTTTGMT